MTFSRVGARRVDGSAPEQAAPDPPAVSASVLLEPPVIRGRSLGERERRTHLGTDGSRDYALYVPPGMDGGPVPVSYTHLTLPTKA